MEKPYQCKNCPKSFQKKKNLSAHQKTHITWKAYKCSYCEREYSHKQTLEFHEKWHTNETPYQCISCDKSFASKKELKCHELFHGGENIYKCKHCGMGFSDKASRLRHLQSHAESKYKCNECGEIFRWNRLLTAHYTIHTGENPYQCNSCEKSYPHKSSLVSHMKTHTREKQHSSEKQHKCAHCTKAFHRANSLERHTCTHSLKKTYSCSECNSTFTQNDNLKTHMKKKHTNQLDTNKSSNIKKRNQENFQNNSVIQKNIKIDHMVTQNDSHGIWLGRVNKFHNKTDCTTRQKPKSKGKITSDEILSSDDSSIPLFCDDSAKVIFWFQQNKLLKSLRSCDSCGHAMIWSETSELREGFAWICQTKGCIKYQQNKDIKFGSFFVNSNVTVTLPDWFDIMYLWSENVKAEVASTLIDINETQIMDCYATFREVCWAYFIENPIKLGGPGIIVEIDVARFPENSKINEGKAPIMVLGIIASNNSPSQGYMEIVESSDAATLLPILSKIVEPGSIVYTKDSKEYCKAQYITEMETIKNHSLNFLDINTLEHVANIQSFWDRHSTHIKYIHNCEQIYQDSYVKELMWRDHFSDDSFKILCQHISYQYPL